MTDVVEPSYNSVASSTVLAAAIGGAGGTGVGGASGWIVPPDEDVLASWHPSLSNGPLDGFEVVDHDGLTVRIRSGEAFVSGRYLARDVPTTVSVPPNADRFSMFIGIKRDETPGLTVGNQADLAGFQEWLALGSVDSDSTGITEIRDVRRLGAPEGLSSNVEELQDLITDLRDDHDGLRVDHDGLRDDHDALAAAVDGTDTTGGFDNYLTPNAHIPIDNMENELHQKMDQIGVRVPPGHRFELYQAGIDTGNTVNTGPSSVVLRVHHDVTPGAVWGTIDYELWGNEGEDNNGWQTGTPDSPLATIDGLSPFNPVYMAIFFDADSGSIYAGAFFSYRIVPTS